MSLSIGDYAFKVCHAFKEATTEIEKERKEQFSKQTFLKKAPYYAATIFAVGALIATGVSISFAVVSFSFTPLVVAAITAAAAVVFGYLRERFNSYTDVEERVKERFLNPLGLDKNQDSIPEPAALRGHRHYMESLVAPPSNEKMRVEQERNFKAVQTFFAKKLDPNALKSKIGTLAVTSLLLETIQHLYDKEQETQSKQTAQRALQLLDLTSFCESDKKLIEKLLEKMKAPTREFKEQLAATIIGANGKPQFRLIDIDKLVTP